METRYTKHQTARAAHVDFESHDKIVLIKGGDKLRLTYQVKVLTDQARDKGKKLIICMRKGRRPHRSLYDFREKNRGIVKFEYE